MPTSAYLQKSMYPAKGAVVPVGQKSIKTTRSQLNVSVAKRSLASSRTCLDVHK